MFEHLVHLEPEAPTGDVIPLAKAAPDAILSAQVATSDWLRDLGAPDDEEIVSGLQTQAAREAFGVLTTATTDDEKREALVKIKTPPAVAHLVGMLTAYDWEFVQQAKELRGYTVAKLVEETQNPTASIRLKALALLGKVTEVGLFTEKIEIKKAEMSDEEIDAKIKEKLNKFMGVVDVTDVYAAPDETTTPPAPAPFAAINTINSDPRDESAQPDDAQQD